MIDNHCKTQAVGYIVRAITVISRFLKRCLKAKHTRAPAYSRALRRIKRRFPNCGSRDAQVRFLEYQEGTE